MFTKLLFILVIFWSVSNDRITNVPDSLALQVGESKSGSTSKDDDNKAFEFINIKTKDKKYLFVQVVPTGDSQFMKFEMSLYQVETNELLMACSSDNIIEECRVPESRLKQNQSLMVGIVCDGECQYLFYSYWSDIETLQPQETTKFVFGQRGKMQEYHVNLPDTEFTEFRVTLIPQTRETSTERVMIYGKFGFQNSPNAGSYDFKSMHLWDNGQGIFLAKYEIKSNKISLLVEGQSSTVYVLKTEIVTGKSHEVDLNETLYEHLLPNSVRIYHVKFPQNKEVEYEITLLQYAGVLQIMSFKDENLKQPLQKQPFKYQKDAKMLITHEQQKNIRELYMKVESKDHDSIFLISFNARGKEQAMKLTENVNQQLNIYNQLQIVYVEYHKWDTKGDNQTSYITLEILKVFGSISVQFRVCKTTVDQCISTLNYTQNTQTITHYDTSQVGLKSIYKFNISDNSMINVNQVQKAGYLIIVFKNDNADPKLNPALAMIDYKLSATVELIREGRALQDIVSFGDVKYYKYLNSEPEVTSIKFHLVQISGHIEVQALRKDPRSTIQRGQVTTANPIIFSENLLEPVYIKITGLSQAIFGISIQLGHITDNIISSISLSEDVKFKIKIKPSSAEVFTLHPLYNSIAFNYKATGTVISCILTDRHVCENDFPVLNTEGLIQKSDLTQIETQVRIRNPSTDRIVEIEVHYHSATYSHCDDSKMGDLIHKVFKNAECLKYTLDPKGADLDIFVQRVDLGKLRTSIEICDRQLTISPKQFRYKLDQEQVRDLCKDKTPTDWVMLITLTSESVEKNLKAELLVQYKGKMITLPDGIAYRTKTTTSQGALGFYYYELLNNIDTRVMLKNYEGRTTMYAKIIEAKQWLNALVSKNDHEYEPTTPQYLTHPTMFFSEADLKVKCQRCAIVIAVYSLQSLGKPVDYSIQAVQNAFVLKDHQLTSAVLVENSTAYYQYYAHKNNQTIVIQLSDNNMKCATMYLSMNDFPTISNNIGVEDGNRMILKGVEGRYYIGVFAKQTCYYTITAYNTPYTLIKLERGNPSDVQLKSGNIKYFIFEHIANTSFKLLLLEKHGQAKIYANKSQSSFSYELKNNQVLDHQVFSLKSSTGNALSVSPTDIGFCFECYYIVAVEATTDIQAAFLLVDENTPIFLTYGKQFSDEIKGKDQITNIKYPNSKAGKLQIVVHAGSVQFTVTKEGESKKSPPIHPQKTAQEFEFNFEKTDKTVWVPIGITSKCLVEHCAYSLKVVTSQSSSDYTILTENIKPGSPIYISIRTNEIKCIQGFITNKEEKIIISTNRRTIQVLSQLKFDVKIGQKKEIKTKDFLIRNVLEISFDLDGLKMENIQPFQFCIKLTGEKSFVGMVQQSSNVNLLPVDTEVPVRFESTFLIYPEGPFILDIFECTGSATLLHGIKQSDLDSESKMASLATLGMPDQPHAIKMDSYTSTMLRIKSPLSLVRWIPIEQSTHRGMGYIQYSIGTLKYSIQGGGINIIWDTLKVGDTKSKVSQLTYRIYISNSQQHLKSATQCERFLDADVMVIQGEVSQVNWLNKQIIHYTSKAQILEKFSSENDLFFNVVADLKLEVQSNQVDTLSEDYRMIYHQQQIPNQVFKNLKQEQFNLILLISLIFSGIVGLFCCTYVITRVLVPVISRIRSNNLVEENPDPREGSEIIPPSSQRNRLPSRKVGEDLIVSATDQKQVPQINN